MDWADTTGYSRDKPRIQTTWTASAGDLRITVTRSHIYHPDKWVMHCEPWYNAKVIGPGSMEVDRAKVIALDLVRRKVEAIHAALGV